MKTAVYASDAGAGRESLNALLKAASNKEFEAVIVTRLDYFGTPEEAAMVFKHLQSNGIKLFDELGEITEGFISKLTS